MKKLTTLLAALCVCAQMSAVPAKPVKRTVQQSDGTTLTIMLHGDENFHFYTTLDGIPVVEDANGSFSYATVQNGLLAASRQLAHNAETRTTAEANYVGSLQTAVKNHISTTWTQRAEKRNAHRLERAKLRRTQAAKAPRRAGSSMEGNKKGLVILVNFKDKTFKKTRQDYDNCFNTEGYNKDQHIGSVRDYFFDQSYGKLTIDFDVVGPYTLKNNMAYYGGNDSQGNDKAPEEMVLEAVQAANDEVNFADYDWDGDGEVDQVYVIYAGFGEASGAASNTIWPHEWQLSAGLSGYPNGVKLDGVYIDTYACSNELSGISGSRMDGIGTACHEFSHCLGLPDFYDTTYEGGFGMGPWSVLDGGCYNGPTVGSISYDGSVPCAYNAYERMFAGWLTPTELKEGAYISGMKAITDAPEAYIIYNEANKNEYYLLQNIQLSGWNKCAYGHGLLVMHVDYNANAWAGNTVNNTLSHQRCTIIPADNTLKMTLYQGSYYTDYNDVPGDPYPGTSNNHSLTDTTTPAATLYNNNKGGKKLMNKPIEDIQEANGLISFSFNGGEQIPAPVATDATNVTENGFTANWNVVEGAETYTLELTEKNTSPLTGTTLLEEDFTGFDAITNMNTDVSTSLDTYTNQSGWTGTKVFGGKATGQGFGVRLGSSQKAGSITSPLLDAPATGEVEITFKAGPWNANNKASFVVVLTSASGAPLDSMEYSVSTTTEDLTFTASTDIDEPFTVTFRTNSKGYRMFLGNLTVYNGEKPASAQRRAAAKQTIEGITTNSYTLTGLTGQKYTYRVKAVANGKESEWSNSITLVISEIIDAIEQSLWEDGTVEVYNSNGIFLRRTSLANWQNNLPRGIYILKSAGSTRKIVK